MGVFTFVCRNGGGGEWCAKQIGESEKQVEETSAGDIYSLQRRLVQAAASLDSSGGVQSSFSLVTPDSAVFQVIIGGGSGGGAFIGAGAASGGAAAASGAGAAAAAADDKEEEKKEDKEESDDDMGFSLFD